MRLTHTYTPNMSNVQRKIMDHFPNEKWISSTDFCYFHIDDEFDFVVFFDGDIYIDSGDALENKVSLEQAKLEVKKIRRFSNFK